MLYIGVDLGGTNIAAGIVSEEGKILQKMSCPTDVARGPEAVCVSMAELCKDLMEQSGREKSEFAAIGIGVPGLVNAKEGKVYFCTNLFWKDVPVREIIGKIVDLPVYLGNDATVAGLAEAVAGASRGAENAIFLTLGTGVGGGFVLGGKAYNGSHSLGGEPGHMVIDVDGKMCTCGKRGCWERYASATALIEMGREAAKKNPQSLILKKAGGVEEKIDARAVIDAAREGDEAAKDVFERYVYYLAMGMVSLTNLFDPEIIVLGGGVSGAGTFLLDAVREVFLQNVFSTAIQPPRIELAVLGNDAGIIGAAMLGR